MEKLKDDEIELFLDFEIPSDSEVSFCDSEDDDSDAENNKNINDDQEDNIEKLNLLPQYINFLGDMDNDIRFENNNPSNEPDGFVIIDENDVHDFDSFFNNIILQTQTDSNVSKQTIPKSDVATQNNLVSPTQTSNQILNPIATQSLTNKKIKTPSTDSKKTTPYSVFIQLFTESLFEKIRTETIKYAVQNGKENFNLSIKELKVFFAINIAMTYIKYPNVRMYWSSQEGLRMNLIADAMTCNRFAEIKRFIHFVDNYEKPQVVTDKFWKIRPVLDILHNSFHSAISTSQNIAIDEMMVPFKGRSSLKQYLKSKPKKWGFKIWVQAGTNGYVHCFELYQGASKDKKSLFGPIGDTVLKLCHSIHGENHKLFMDNLFTTVPLLRKLKSLNIHVLGTLRLNRVTGIENYLVKDKLLERGNCSIATSDDNLTVVRWKDTKLVHTISTYAGASPEDITSRYDRKEKKKIEVTRPFAIQEYNKFMGGVDLMDRMIAHYPHGFKNKKWFILRGAIDYGSDHYTGYVSRADGTWEAHNDLRPKIPKNIILTLI
ncbi:piggyBac transposable element-derived protein 3-like [Rhopalosiphum padi]|uniref:piggyBac transposable element-derived protein 3-like n=1 Tax=Rhopalosiphum padi TaxID=40932 RepID=UPI00298E55AA|nr:piggyBac transposable element-derived protein 3-like [Rhopalosiphum padi]